MTFYQDVFLFFFFFNLILFAVVVIKCFMIGVNVWGVYLAPQNIPRAISVLTLGNKVILYCIVLDCIVLFLIVLYCSWYENTNKLLHWSRQVLAYRCTRKKRCEKDGVKGNMDGRLKADTVTVELTRPVVGLTESQAQARRWQKLFVVRAEYDLLPQPHDL